MSFRTHDNSFLYQTNISSRFSFFFFFFREIKAIDSFWFSFSLTSRVLIVSEITLQTFRSFSSSLSILRLSLSMSTKMLEMWFQTWKLWLLFDPNVLSVLATVTVFVSDASPAMMAVGTETEEVVFINVVEDVVEGPFKAMPIVLTGEVRQQRIDWRNN